MISLKCAAWMLVIFVQAIIHFGLGRKRSFKNEEDEFIESASEVSRTKQILYERTEDVNEKENANHRIEKSPLSPNQINDGSNSTQKARSYPAHSERLGEKNGGSAGEAFFSCMKSTDSVGTAETVADPVDDDSDYDHDEQWKYELQHFEDDDNSVETIHMLIVKMRDSAAVDTEIDSSQDIERKESSDKVSESLDMIQTATATATTESQQSNSGTLVLPSIECL